MTSTGITTTELGELEYNGYRFGARSHVIGTTEFVYDDAGRTVVAHRHVITVTAIVAPDGEDDLNTTMGALRTKLSVAGQYLKLNSKGWGLPLLLNYSSSERDILFGPKPKVLNWTPVGHTGAAEIVWEVEFHTSPCGNNSSGLAAFNYEIKFGINSRGYSSRSVTGYLQVAMTRDGRNIPDTADAYRELVVVQSPANFKRDSQDYSLSADKTRLNFSVIDKEIESPNAFPQGVVEITARHRARWTKRGRSRYRLPNTISANIVLSADQPRIRAWEIFRLLVSARTVYATQSSSTSSPVIIESLDVEEDLFGPSLSFSVDYSVLASLEDFFGKTGLLSPLGNNWSAWKSSIETAESQRGFADLKHTKEEDRITDLCDIDPATGQPSNIPFIGPNTDHVTFCNPKPTKEKSWLEFEASIIDETDSSTIVSGTIGESEITAEEFNPSGGDSILETIDVDGVAYEYFQGTPNLEFRWRGTARRVGYPIPKPHLKRIKTKDGYVDAKLVGKPRFLHRPDGKMFCQPVFTAAWDFRYSVTSPVGSLSDEDPTPDAAVTIS